MKRLDKMFRMLLIALFFTSLLEAEEWETLRFKVVQEVPDPITLVDVAEHQEGGSWAQNKIDKLRTKTIDDVFINEIENYLTKIAVTYERMGFRFPHTDDQKDSRILVYLYNYDDGESLAKSGCSQPKGKKKHCYLKLDTSRLFSNSSIEGGLMSQKISDSTYENLAHELFHSVQRAYPVFAVHEDLGDWIVEGTAQAMGVAMLNKIQKEKKNLTQRYGVRQYSTPLRVADDVKKRRHEGYHTSSLWEYIGEHISTHGHPDVKEVKPADYRYLHRLFETNIDGKTSENKELAWLDNFLKSDESKIAKKLAYIYPHFITTFTYFTAKEEPFRIQATKFEGVDNWHKCLFSMECAIENSSDILNKQACKKIYLDDNTPKVLVSETFKKVSSRCFEVFYKGEPSTDISVGLISKDMNVVNSIRALGLQKELTSSVENTGGSEKWIEVFTSKDIKNSNTGKIEGASWELKAVNFRNRESVIFVMSNIAKNVKKTLSSPKVRLVFLLPSDRGNITLSNKQESEGR